jgi:elongation factor Tu
MQVYRCLLHLWSWNGCYWSCESHSPLRSSRDNPYTEQVERGIANKGDEVEVVGLGTTFKTTLTGIGASSLHLHVAFLRLTKIHAEMFHKELDRGEAGDNMGALLRGVKREQLKRGQVIVAPGSIKAVRSFLAQIYVSRTKSSTISILNYPCDRY